MSNYKYRLGKLFICFVMIVSSSIYAAEVVESPRFLPPNPTHANWVFSGVVTNESGESYGYFFQMQRNGDQFHSIAALFDGQDKRVILLDEDQAVIHDASPYNWHVGRAFLLFN